MSLARKSKYTDTILATVTSMGHATNAQILLELQHKFPELSATTIHRATAKLQDRGHIAKAPIDKNGSTVYDANITPHDHFICSSCGTMRDIDVYDQIISKLKEAVDNCNISGRLTINGNCSKCLKKEIK